MDQRMIFAVFIIIMAAASVYVYSIGGLGSLPFTLWFGDYVGVMDAGQPDKIVFPSFYAQYQDLNVGDDLRLEGSFYANLPPDDPEMCSRIGGSIKTSGAWVGSCILNGLPLTKIDYIVDDQGNNYVPYNIGFSELSIKFNGYTPSSMVWVMSTSAPEEPPVIPPVEPPVTPPDEPPIDEFPYIVIVVIAGIGVMMLVARKYL